MNQVAFCVAHDTMPWSAHDIERRGLGGAETAVVRVAAGLADLGYAVAVYANVAAEETIARVAYRRRRRFDPTEPRAAVISCRDPQIFDERPAAGRTLLWIHDPDAGKELTPERAENIDHVVGLSAWHADRLRACHPFAAPKVVQISHGFDPSYFAGAAVRRQRVISTCQPERGVDVLLELWPEVRRAVPEAELMCCHAPYCDYERAWHPKVAPHRGKVRDLARQPGVRLLGPLSQPQLANLLMGARVYVHPSWYSPWKSRCYETFCISAIEAQAAGLWAVASGWGALPETVRVGALIDGDGAPGPAWKAAFVEQIVLGLTDRALQRYAEAAGPEAVRELTWERPARAFAQLIAGTRSAGEPEAVTSRDSRT